MKKPFLRVLIVNICSLVYGSFAIGQTINLPTIPCSVCNGPGSFSIIAPTCGGGPISAPLTLSWAVSTGANSYTVMLATDANFTQNVGTTTTSGTSLSIKNFALKANQLYYWIVFANSATGSTKANNSCQFMTDGTFTGTTIGSFPNGENMVSGLVGSSYSCQKGDGTCASGDNMICNPKVQRINTAGVPFVPYWFGGGTLRPWADGETTVSLSQLGIPLPPSGNDNALVVTLATVGTDKILSSAYQLVRITNSSNIPANYEVSFYVRSNQSTLVGEVNFYNYKPFPIPLSTTTGATAAAPYYSLNYAIYPVRNVTANSTNWQQSVNILSIPAQTTIHAIGVAGFSPTADPTNFNYITYVTDFRLCKL